MKKNKKQIKKQEIKLIDITKIRISPEFEFEMPNEKIADKLIERGRTLRGWEIKSDGSLNSGIELSPEKSNKIYYNEDSLMQIKEILALVRCYRGKAMETCGLHWHVDVKKFSNKQILTIIREWVAKQRFIIKRFKISQNRLEETCKILPRGEIRKLTEKEINQYRNGTRTSFRSYGYLDEKYYSLSAIHLPKTDYSTLEFRLFPSTTNFKEIKSIMYFILTFIQEALERE